MRQQVESRGLEAVIAAEGVGLGSLESARVPMSSPAETQKTTHIYIYIIIII